jgi:hypothetical protein
MRRVVFVALTVPTFALATPVFSQDLDLSLYRACVESHSRYQDYHLSLLETGWRPVSPSEEQTALDAINDALLVSHDVTEHQNTQTIERFRETNRAELDDTLENSLLRTRNGSFLLLGVYSGPNGDQRVLCWVSNPGSGSLSEVIETARQDNQLLQLEHGTALGLGPLEIGSGMVHVRYFEASDALALSAALTSRVGLMLDTIIPVPTR